MQELGWIDCPHELMRWGGRTSTGIHHPILKEEMYVIDWIEAQNKDPVIWKAIEWVQLGKERSLKYHLRDLASTLEGLGFISTQKSLVLVNGKLYLKWKLKGEVETTVVFIVPNSKNLLMVFIGMQVIRAKTGLLPCYSNGSGGLGWPWKSNPLWRTANSACIMMVRASGFHWSL